MVIKHVQILQVGGGFWTTCWFLPLKFREMIQFDDPPFDEEKIDLGQMDGATKNAQLAGEWLNFLQFFVGLHMNRQKSKVQTLFARWTPRVRNAAQRKLTTCTVGKYVEIQQNQRDFFGRWSPNMF